MVKNQALLLAQRLKESLRERGRESGDSGRPVAILWTDLTGEWTTLIGPLQAVLPELFVLGKYDPTQRRGPAIWLKCIVDRTVPEAPTAGVVPVLYLPRVSRQELRAAGDCPPALQPLVELQFRGRVWHQSNGHDWTVRAFLVSDEGLALDVAADRRTEDAFLRVLPILAETDARTLKGRRLDADDFDKLSVQDPVRDLLLWLNNAEAFEATAKGSRWESFRGLCQSEFGFDPDRVPAAEVAGLLIRAELGLDRVWSRFAESPQLYPGVAKLLKEPVGAGQGLLVLDPSRDPRINERDETELRQDLQTTAGLPQAQACAKVLELEGRHAVRRDWVWARTDMSPWAVALRPLARLAQAARKPVGGATLSAAAAEYASSGWECDAAAMEALGRFRNGPDAALLVKVVRALYEPWLDGSARHFQVLVAKEPSEARKGVFQPAAEKDTCLLFVDGLRFDLAGKLAARLDARGFRVSMTHRLAPLPTVTPTAKLAATPITDGIKGGNGDDFTPLIQAKSGWKPVIAPLLRERLETSGVELLDPNEIRIPAGGEGGGWTECGNVDSMGHSLQGELVHQLDVEVDRIADRAFSLIDSGWRRVRVVTDHGWLLLPGGLPKVELAPYLAETKWARCAVVKGQPDLNIPVSPWYWNPDVQIASPPGIGAFRAGETYAHGGISPQECVVPELIVERGASATYASIQSVEWRGMRCRVRVDSNDPKVRVDLRKSWKQESTSIAAATKEIGPAGEVSMAVPDDAHEGAAAFVVLLDPEGKVIASQTTCVGEKP
ncbi:BREX-1 system phosphatase PglZ type B [Bryobacter aggregatus]|uniref:BREX-1 system phosphatase PglZ type B n=1 Tax=Bryobacter aggregatus TaxID=360054 RepID=UPI0004E0E840|nr:BREX-1 system phosphatase PglZ type B [Bryobacter aggregatus]